MWRSFFLAIGITFCILGLEFLVIEEAVISRAPANSVVATGEAGGRRQITIQEWMPWSFLSAGAVIILYTYTLPKRFQS